jgi:hypothetical protein
LAAAVGVVNEPGRGAQPFDLAAKARDLSRPLIATASTPAALRRFRGTDAAIPNSFAICSNGRMLPTARRLPA